MAHLFDTSALPEGFLYVPDAISQDEERELLAVVGTLPLKAAIYRGFTAKRRIVFFEDAVPEFLSPLRDHAATLGGVDRAAITTALVTEYSPGAVMGWHRDAPQYGPVVIGYSLAGACRMRLRRIGAEPRDRSAQTAVTLAPRSAYVMGGTARSEWQHSIPAVETLRYSITFRTRRASQKREKS
jgi:alkylated DNA repair protein (DNA oxidative demethylase)